MLSNAVLLGTVQFPVWTGERIYMQEFTKKKGLPKQLSRWQPTVDQMLEHIDTEDKIYLMVDQGIVSPDKPHRRSGVHVDGYWNPSMYTHGGGHGGHSGSPGRWKVGHIHTSQLESEAIVLASDVAACAAYIGEWDDVINEGGDCSHIDVTNLEKQILEPNKVYAGHTLTMLHESLPFNVQCQRTLVRLNVKGWLPN